MRGPQSGFTNMHGYREEAHNCTQLRQRRYNRHTRTQSYAARRAKGILERNYHKFDRHITLAFHAQIMASHTTAKVIIRPESVVLQGLSRSKDLIEGGQAYSFWH